MKNKKKLYLICSDDNLQTAFFCGTAEECTRVLGLSSIAGFYCAISKGTRVMNFFRIERAPKGVT